MNPRPTYNYEKVSETARQYETRGEFVKHHEPSYRWALRNNVLDDVCSHMEYVRKYWDFDSVIEEAKKYITKKEFQTEARGAYEWALNNNHLDDACAHMEIKGHKYKRALYVYEFKNNSAYIGLTFDYHKRDLEHRRRGRVFQELKKSSAKFIKLNKWMSAKEAQVEERNLIEKYEKEGWYVLNITTGGSLGGNDLKWDENSLKKEALKYKTI
jgi:predicted GIY-YIG superfamily endonuclease